VNSAGAGAESVFRDGAPEKNQTPDLCLRKQKTALAPTFAIAVFRESTSSFDPIVRASDCIAGAAANSPLVGKWSRMLAPSTIALM
jgi:hypothetical protein